MPTPSLLKTRKVVVLPHMGAREIHKINTQLAKDYILDKIAKHVPTRRGGATEITPRGIGDKIMLIRADTGSGKSVTLGPEIYKKYNKTIRKFIGITQPRVLTTLSLPEDIVSIYPEMKLGTNIGYQTRDYTFKPKNGIIFMTVGVIARQLIVMSDDEFMGKYAFIIIDECHDRSLEMDITLSLIKQFISRNYNNSECPFVILTSATFDTGKYADYFNVDRKHIITVQGLNYPISVNFPKISITNYIYQSTRQALAIHNENVNDYGSGVTDILIFASGAADIKKIKEILDGENDKLDNHYITIGLTGRNFKVGDADYQNIFKPLDSINTTLKNGKNIIPKRRIIIATNVAETGVTIDTLKYVIDTGYELSAVFNPVYGSKSLISKNITNASALQRKGRVGRRAPGAWYPMYTEESFNSMPTNNHPSMLTSNICIVILGLIIETVYPGWDGTISKELQSHKKFNMNELDLLDAPSHDSLQYSMERLFVLGMIDSSCVPTTMGLASTYIQHMDIELIRMMFAGYHCGANVLDLITIASFMSLPKRDYIDIRSKKTYSYKSVFNKDDNELVYYNKIFIADDFIKTLFIWEDFMDQVQIMEKVQTTIHIKKWCDDNGLIYNGLLRVIGIRDDLISTFIQDIGLDPYHNGLNIDGRKYSLRKHFQTNINIGLDEIYKLKKCIYEGFRLSTATWNRHKNVYVLDNTHKHIKIQSESTKPLPTHTSFTQTRPLNIVARDVDLRLDTYKKIYKFECDRISVMDGFVDIDVNFTSS